MRLGIPLYDDDELNPPEGSSQDVAAEASSDEDDEDDEPSAWETPEDGGVYLRRRDSYGDIIAPEPRLAESMPPEPRSPKH